MTRAHTKQRIKRALRRMTPQHIVRARITRRTIEHFADKVGLVYFGYVDQRDDDYRLIRGHTVSATHLDEHYCIGTVNGYDVMLALRNDFVQTGAIGSDAERHHWLIYTIDLHTKSDVPHCYVGHRSRDALYMAGYNSLKPLLLGALHPYSHDFVSKYTIYAQAGRALEIERVITPQIADTIAVHFRGASFEILDNTIYLYVETEHPEEATLEKLLSSGLWLAESIDTAYALVH